MNSLYQIWDKFQSLPVLWQRIFKYSILLIILLIFVQLGLGYWYTRNFIPENWYHQSEKYKVTIGYNKWGVPHIEGKRDVDVAFGLAVSHSTNALDDITTLLHIARGTHGIISSEGLKTDYLVGMLRSREVAQNALDENHLSQEVLDYLNAYADGLNYFAVINRGLVDKRLYPVTVVDILSSFHMQHLLFFGFANEISELLELEKGEQQTNPDELAKAPWEQEANEKKIGVIGSNAFAVAPGLTWGNTYIVINSHQPTEGPFAWFHVALKSEEGIDIEGGSFPGSPFVFVGFNEEIAWGATVNRPKLYDRYLLQVNEEQTAYKFDGLWQEFEELTFTLPIQLIGNLRFNVSQTRKISKHGPVFETDEGWYALNYVTMNQTLAPEQWFRMQKSKSWDEWWQAMHLRYIPSFNFIVADKTGNIGYLYNALLRDRETYYDGSNYLPGTSSDALNLPTVPFEKIPQVRNPESGYVISANHSPFKSTADRNAPNPDDFPDSWGIETRMTNRGYVLIDAFKHIRQVTEENIFNLKYDNSYNIQSDARKKNRTLTQCQYQF